MIDENLKDKPREALSGTGKVRSFQRKIYLKAKQEKEYKSQRKCKLYRHRAFVYLVYHYGLIDPARYTFV